MKAELDKALVMLKKLDKIDVWDDTGILAGQEWSEEIKTALQNADVIILLISVDFNNSKYIWEHEFSTAIDRYDKGEVRIIPVILRTCEWMAMPYSKFQVLPTNAKPIASFVDKDEAYTDVARGIRRVVENLQSK